MTAPTSAAPFPHDEAALVRLGRSLLEGGYRFAAPTPATHARVNARPGNAEATDLAGALGWSRPFRAGALPPAVEDALREAGALEGTAPGRLRSRLRFSTLDVPFGASGTGASGTGASGTGTAGAGTMGFFHSAFPTEAADSVFFGPDTYRFAAAIAPALPPRVVRAVDIGCGAGPGGLVVARARPDAAVLMGDINGAALRLARVNARVNGIANARAVESDLLDAVPEAPDLIVSNPPYLNDPLCRAYRHGGGALGASLSLRILEASLARLAPGGTLLLYTGVAIVGGADTFREAAANRLAGGEVDWEYRELDPDVFGEELDTANYRDADRIAVVLLRATKKG